MSGDVEPAGGRRWHRRADGAGLRRTARAAGPASSPDPVSFSLASRVPAFPSLQSARAKPVEQQQLRGCHAQGRGGGAGGASTTPHGPLSPRVSATPSGPAAALLVAVERVHFYSGATGIIIVS